MSKNEGEFELVLGNKQLLSGFFIVVILFGVFFTMGYVVGRNSSPARAPASASFDDIGKVPSGGARSEVRVREPVQTPEPESPAPAAQTAKEESAAAAGTAHTYLQVLAVKRPDAEVVLETLRKRGFPAVIAPGPNDTIFRVLVGPYKDTTGIGKVKADLESAGFKPFIVRK